MELKELQSLWQKSGNDPSPNRDINLAMVSELSTLRIKSRLGGWKWNIYFEMACNFLFLSFLFDFMARHIGSLKMLLPAAFLALMMALGLALGVYKLVVYYGINLRDSVVKAQKRIERLRFVEIQEVNLLLVAIPLFSTAIMIVFAQAFIGYDLYVLGDYLIWYTVGSAVVGLIVVFLLKKFPNRRLQETIAFLQDIKDAE
jgi:hypothetical protein